MVGFLVVVDVAGPLQYLQGGMDADGEVAEALAEFLDIEFMADAVAVAKGYLIIIGQMLVDLPDIVAGRKGVVDALGQLAVVAVVVEQNGLGRLPVASSTTGFLEIGLQGVRAVVVDHHAHVRLVNTHAEGVGGYHDAHPVVLPVALALVLVCIVESGMVERGAEPCLAEVFGNLAGMPPAADIDNG